MSSIGVVVFRNALGKSPVLQDAVDNSVNITNNDARRPRREIIIVRKKQHKPPPPPTVAVTTLVRDADALALPPAKRPRAREPVPEDTSRTPTPLAVARRNARERNRVRQVNDGFAALRRHIPEEVAEVFETANTSRGPNKKLSKVETLRMAVEYIRNLETLLNIGPAVDKENASRPSAESFPSPASSTSPHGAGLEHGYFSLNSPQFEDDEFPDDDESDPPAPRLLTQFGRLPPSDAFRLVSTPHLYEEDDPGQPTTPSSDLLAQEELAVSPHFLDRSFPFASAAEQFTVIHDTYCDPEVRTAENAQEFEMKYSDSLDGQIHCEYSDHQEVPLDVIHPDLVLSQDQYKFKDSVSTAFDDNYSDMELKKELPDIQVTPEDREQFEETLKWWQEKTRQARPVIKSSAN